MRKSKPTRKIRISWRGSRGVVHWGTLKKVTAKPEDRARIRIMRGLTDWHPACTEKYNPSAVELPKDWAYKVTCPSCIDLWGRG